MVVAVAVMIGDVGCGTNSRKCYTFLSSLVTAHRARELIHFDVIINSLPLSLQHPVFIADKKNAELKKYSFTSPNTSFHFTISRKA